jgi:prepilin peptidase CpaA
MIRDILILTVFPAAMAVAAINDFFTMMVPNRLALGLVVLFFPVAYLAGLGLADIGLHAALAIALLALALVLFEFNWIGGGDAKLFAATSLWLGPEAILPYAIYAALIGGALTLLIMFWRRRPLPATFASVNWLERLHSQKEGVPYGIALGAAGMLAYLDTPFWVALGG